MLRDLYDDHDWVTVQIKLGAAPPGPDVDRDAWMVAGLGHVEDSTCVIHAEARERTRGGEQTSERLYYLGPRDYNTRIGPRPERPYTCFVAWTEALDRSAMYDLMGGTPKNTWKAPALTVGKITQLGVTQKKLKLVKGAWTPYAVVVRNTGSLPVAKVTVRLQVKHTGPRKKSAVKLRAAAPRGVAAARTVTVARIKAPKRPVAGRYAGSGAGFTIAQGRVTGFSMTTVTRCESMRDTQNTYSFPPGEDLASWGRRRLPCGPDVRHPVDHQPADAGGGEEGHQGPLRLPFVRPWGAWVELYGRWWVHREARRRPIAIGAVWVTMASSGSRESGRTRLIRAGMRTMCAGVRAVISGEPSGRTGLPCRGVPH